MKSVIIIIIIIIDVRRLLHFFSNCILYNIFQEFWHWMSLILTLILWQDETYSKPFQNLNISKTLVWGGFLICIGNLTLNKSDLDTCVSRLDLFSVKFQLTFLMHNGHDFVALYMYREFYTE